jgi:hypothetical protein
MCGGGSLYFTFSFLISLASILEESIHDLSLLISFFEVPTVPTAVFELSVG